jgi:hypothetical protein
MVRNAVCAATFQSAASLSLRKNERNTNQQPQPEIGNIGRRVSADYRYIGTFEGRKGADVVKLHRSKGQCEWISASVSDFATGRAETDSANSTHRILSDLQCGI